MFVDKESKELLRDIRALLTLIVKQNRVLISHAKAKQEQENRILEK